MTAIKWIEPREAAKLPTVAIGQLQTIKNLLGGETLVWSLAHSRC